MARAIEIVVPTDQTDAVLQDIRDTDGVIGLRLQRGASLQPAGDVLSIDATSAAIHELMRRLDSRKLTTHPGVTVSTSDVLSLISSPASDRIGADDTEATWEEMEMMIAKEGNMTRNGVAVMAVAGVVATIGLHANAVHLVIGAMVIAPGFEPITRISLGLVARGRSWRRGVSDTALGYGALVLAAVLTALVLKGMGKSLLGGEGSYLEAGSLVSYWTQISATGLLASAAASFAGAVLIASHRSVLTAGVMIALALVPTLVLAAMALVELDGAVAGRAVLRWIIELGLVGVISAMVMAWKGRQQRRAMVS